MLFLSFIFSLICTLKKGDMQAHAQDFIKIKAFTFLILILFSGCIEKAPELIDSTTIKPYPANVTLGNHVMGINKIDFFKPNFAMNEGESKSIVLADGSERILSLDKVAGLQRYVEVKVNGSGVSQKLKVGDVIGIDGAILKLTSTSDIIAQAFFSVTNSSDWAVNIYFDTDAKKGLKIGIYRANNIIYRANKTIDSKSYISMQGVSFDKESDLVDMKIGLYEVE